MNKIIYLTWIVYGALCLGATLGQQQWCANTFTGITIVMLLITFAGMMSEFRKEIDHNADAALNAITQLKHILIADYVIDISIVVCFALYGYKTAAIAMSISIVLGMILMIRRLRRKAARS